MANDIFNDPRFDPIESFKKRYAKNEELIFSTPIDPPFTNACIFNRYKTSTNFINETKPKCVQGINYDLFEYFAKVIGIKWKLVPTDMNIYKMFNTTSKELRGLLGMLNRGEAHGGSTLVYLEEPDEMTMAEYTFPVGITYGGFVYLIPEVRHISEQSLLGIFLPFTWQTWLSILISLAIILSSFLICKTFVEKYFSRKELHGILFYKFVLNVTVLISSTILIYSYQSKLTSEFLLNPKLVYPITNLKDLANVLSSKRYQLVTHSYSSSFLYSVNTSNDETMVTIRQSFEYNPMILANGRDHAMALVASRPSLVYFVSSQLSYELTSSAYCNLTFIVDSLPRYLVFAFQKHSGLADLFNRFMYASGYSASDLKSIVESKYLKQKSCVRKPDDQLVNKEKPLTMQQLYGSFVFIALGVLLGITSLVIERWKLRDCSTVCKKFLICINSAKKSKKGESH